MIRSASVMGLWGRWGCMLQIHRRLWEHCVPVVIDRSLQTHEIETCKLRSRRSEAVARRGYLSQSEIPLVSRIAFARFSDQF